MQTSTARRLMRLNRDFYDAFAAEFADSRSALQPGIVRALRAMGQPDSLLDVGCGDGRVGRALARREIPQVTVNRYVGVDFSPALLEQSGTDFPVRRAPGLESPGYEFLQADFSAPGWQQPLLDTQAPFAAVVCFSALHHLPGPRRRLRLLRDLHALLRPGGRCALSVWQFLHVSRLRRKIVPWSEIGLTPDDVDEDDYLLDWRRGGRGLRYVHHFDEPELVALCRRAGFTVLETYRSDGETGDMGLYVICRRDQ